MTNHPRHILVRRHPRALAIALAAGTLLMGGATTAEAHDSLLGTSPAAGSTTVAVPARVTLTLSEPALAVGTTVVVTGPAGPVQAGKPALLDNTIAQRLQPGSPAGAYTVTWRATSADGHPVSGRFSFTAAKASPGGSATPTTPVAPATSTTPTPSTAPTASAAARPASPVPAAATGGAAARWGLLAGGLVVLLLLGTFLVRRKPRSTPDGERDSRS